MKYRPQTPVTSTATLKKRKHAGESLDTITCVHKSETGTFVTNLPRLNLMPLEASSGSSEKLWARDQ
jgi:hypothetical protein